MNRLTKRYKSGIVTLDADAFMETQEAIDREIQNCYPAKKAVERLAEYEDAEENGLMVHLPCKVGDTVYQVATERIYESKIKQVIYDVGHFGFDESAIGTSVFLTKGEAEQALKERDSK